MTGVNHVVTGGIIGALLPQPLLAIPLAFLSHFILDILPHYGNHPDDHLTTSPGLHRLIWVDTFLGASFLAMLIIWQPVNWVVIFFAGAFAQVPDLVWLPNYVRLRRGLKQRTYNSLMRFHKYIQWAESPRPFNIMVEAAWLLVATTVFFRIAQF